MTILAVCKDPGGMSVVLPVVRELRTRGLEVLFVTNGKASDLVTDDHVAVEDIGDVQSQLTNPDVFVTSMCSEGGVGRDLVPFVGCPVIAVQDAPGAQLLTSWVDEVYRPDVICVNDSVCGNIVARAWPDMGDNRIVVTGSPASDIYAGIETREIAKRVQNELGTADGKPIIVFGGEKKHTAHMLREVVTALNSIRPEAYLILRMHPRMDSSAPGEGELCKRALTELEAPGVAVVIDTSAFTTEEIVVSGDVVVSGFSTVLEEAAKVRVPGIAVLYEGAMLSLFYEITGTAPDGRLLMDIPVIVSTGCAKMVQNQDELRIALELALTHQLGLEAAQAETYQLDGRNTERVVDLIISYL